MAARSEHPVYLRFGKAPLYGLHGDDTTLAMGKALLVREGMDVAFLATGETVIHALLAAGELEAQGISSRVLSVPMIRPLDKETVLRAGRECRAVITVEEHLVHGGLGEACAATLLEAGVRPRFRIVGLPDEDTVTGSQADIFRHYGLSMESLAATARHYWRPPAPHNSHHSHNSHAYHPRPGPKHLRHQSGFVQRPGSGARPIGARSSPDLSAARLGRTRRGGDLAKHDRGGGRPCRAARPLVLAGVSLANQRETIVVFERGTGRPLHPAIVWQCRRGDDLCRALVGEGESDNIRGRTA
jgi:hypothetical protein